MKGAIRDQLREIAFPETTSLKAPKENVAPKGGKKKGLLRVRLASLGPRINPRVENRPVGSMSTNNIREHKLRKTNHHRPNQRLR
jgi:hypothetical protein